MALGVDGRYSAFRGRGLEWHFARDGLMLNVLILFVFWLALNTAPDGKQSKLQSYIDLVTP